MQKSKSAKPTDAHAAVAAAATAQSDATAIDTPAASAPSAIRIRGARQNNLRGVDVDIPTGGLVVVTGLSGAGKSSLAFDTLHAEGQRRYVETFSPYTRQFLELLPPPRVDSVENVRPSIAVRQGNSAKTSRSTVGTMTGLCDWFKVWFAHRAALHDPETGREIRPRHPANVWEELLAANADANADAAALAPSTAAAAAAPSAAAATAPAAVQGRTDILVCPAATAFASSTNSANSASPNSRRDVAAGFAVARPPGVAWAQALAPFVAQGYTRGLVDGAVLRLEEFPTGADAPAEAVLLQDRVALAAENRARFLEAAARAFSLGRGRMRVAVFAEDAARPVAVLDFHEGLVSASGRRFQPAAPARFSFNSPLGACPSCKGFGRVIGVDWGKVVPDAALSLAAGAIAPFQGEVYGASQRDLLRALRKHGIPAKTPWRELDAEQRAFVLGGEPDYGKPGRDWTNTWYGVSRFFDWLEGNAYKMHVRVFLARYRSYSTCPECGGRRLRADSLCWRWRGRTLPELYAMDAAALLALLAPHRDARSRHPAEQALEAIHERLACLHEVGLGYLSPDRLSRTLSGGEAQRVNLTACIGSGLADTLFVLDEPSVGLHPGDLARMNAILRRLAARREGNTVVVVEHDESVMRAADWLVEIGPLPGAGGGRVVFSGPPAALAAAPTESVTARWLLGKRHPPPPRLRPVPPAAPRLRLRGIHANNLRDLALDLPLGRFNAICGVSGSGKSTLLNEVLAALAPATTAAAVDTSAAAANADAGGAVPVRFQYETDAPFTAIALVDQSPASRTPRSNAALYTGAWEGIRELLAATPEAVRAGLTASHFSFNSGDGRCPHCGGSGWESVEMQFLANVHVPCPVCEGRRFRPEILRFRHREKTVADLLAMTVSEALVFFAGEVADGGGVSGGQSGTSGSPVFPQSTPTPESSPARDPSESGTSLPPCAKTPPSRPAARRLRDILRALTLLDDVGLSYLTLGQPLSTLSGGESQRIKLARFLGEVAPAQSGAVGAPMSPQPQPTSQSSAAFSRANGVHAVSAATPPAPHTGEPPVPLSAAAAAPAPAPHTGALILLDEPTTGLHREDVARLVGVLQRLVDAGNTLVVVEHNADILNTADWLLELGPGPGLDGGRVIAAAPPPAYAHLSTPTAPWLRPACFPPPFGKGGSTPQRRCG